MLLNRTTSTNETAFNELDKNPGRNLLIVAEHQQQGKGRLGSSWLSPMGDNIYLSMLLHYPPRAVNFGSISLCISLAVARTIERWVESSTVSIKWPNDIWINDRKVAGILVESSFEANQDIPIIIGVGINLYPLRGTNAPSHTALYEHTDARHIRNQLIADVANSLWEVIKRYTTHGFNAIKLEWEHYDRLLGQHISLSRGSEQISGVAGGINNNGELILHGDNHQSIAISSGVAKLIRPSHTPETNVN